MLRHRAFLSLLAIGLLTPPPGCGGPAARAEEEPSRPTTPLVERATTELVLIEAYVTDRKGRPIRGLEIDDFVLKIDRRTKPIASIEFFEAVRDAPETAAETKEAAAEPSPGPPTRSLARRFILFFEDDTSGPIGMTQARRKAEEFIESGLDDDDQVAIVAYDFHRKLQILSDFTTDKEKLRGTLRESLHDISRFSDYAPMRNERRVEVSRAGMSASFMADNYATEDNLRWRAVLLAVRTLVEGLAAWPGYKALVFLGDGIPENPGRDYGIAAAKHSLTLEVGSLARAAAAAGVTLHTVQPSGLVVGANAADDVGSVARLNSQARRSNTLETLAMHTGGVAVSHNDLLKSLREVEAASRSHYVLGYIPEGPPDGLQHIVDLRVRKGRRVRYRRSFMRMLPEDAHQAAVQAAHLLPELHPDLGLEFSAVSGPWEASMRVTDLVLYLPARQILFLPREEKLQARLEIGFVAIGPSGRESFRVARKIRVALDPELETSGPLALNLFSRVRLPATSQSITAVVYDLEGGSIGATRLELPETRPEEEKVSGLSLYSLSERSLWIEVDSQDMAEESGEQVAAYTLGPALRSSFTAGEPVACGFKVPSPAAAGHTKLRLVLSQGERVVRVEPLQEGSGGATGGMVKVPLSVSDLPAGGYHLRVERVGAEGAVDCGNLAFRIRSDLED